MQTASVFGVGARRRLSLGSRWDRSVCPASYEAAENEVVDRRQGPRRRRSIAPQVGRGEKGESRGERRKERREREEG